jgi:hypothetical protein
MRWFSFSAVLLAASCASIPPTVQPAGVHVDQNRLMNGSKALTPPFKAIDSFAVSLERGEIVFSAKRGDNFDVGLVSTEGSDIHWIPEDPADEINAQWAPRGNKVSYIVRLATGDVVRTVHIPTSVQLAVDFPNARVQSLTWDPSGDRYSVVISSPDAAPRTESMKYGGEERRTAVAPSMHLDVELEPLAGGVVMRPSSLRYNEKLPIVVWTVSDPLVWNETLGKLMQSAHVAALLVTRAPDADGWKAIEAVPWIDAKQRWVVGEDPVVQSNAAREIAGALTNGRR